MPAPRRSLFAGLDEVGRGWKNHRPTREQAAATGHRPIVHVQIVVRHLHMWHDHDIVHSITTTAMLLRSIFQLSSNTRVQCTFRLGQFEHSTKCTRTISMDLYVNEYY